MCHLVSCSPCRCECVKHSLRRVILQNAQYEISYARQSEPLEDNNSYAYCTGRFIVKIWLIFSTINKQCEWWNIIGEFNASDDTKSNLISNSISKLIALWDWFCPKNTLHLTQKAFAFLYFQLFKKKIIFSTQIFNPHNSTVFRWQTVKIYTLNQHRVHQFTALFLSLVLSIFTNPRTILVRVVSFWHNSNRLGRVEVCLGGHCKTVPK